MIEKLKTRCLVAIQSKKTTPAQKAQISDFLDKIDFLSSSYILDKYNDLIDFVYSI